MYKSCIFIYIIYVYTRRIKWLLGNFESRKVCQVVSSEVMGDKSAEFSFYVTNEKAATEICAGRRCESVARSVVYGVILLSSTTRELVLYNALKERIAHPSLRKGKSSTQKCRQGWDMLYSSLKGNSLQYQSASWISCPWILQVKTRETTFTKATQSLIQIRNYKHQVL